MELIDFILHIDRHLSEFVALHGVWIYGLLFLIVFVETGLVVMPLLPGDSLLFAAGALAAAGHMHVGALLGLLFFAAVLGDNCNYFIGRQIGPRVFSWDSRWLKREYLEKTRLFFEKHGGKAIVIARFMPIIRTFTPFIAGVSAMPYRRFLAFDITGGALWISICIGAGYVLGNLPFFKNNFSAIIFVVIGISLLPAIITWLRQKLTSAPTRS
jgi:membrane-associated protein